MAGIVESFFDGVDTFFAWLSATLKQYTMNYCDLETADSKTVLVNHDGTLVTVLRIDGVTGLIGNDEFVSLLKALENSLQGPMNRPGFAFQMFFSYDKDLVKSDIAMNFRAAMATAERVELNLEDLFRERVEILSKWCARETCYLVLFTRPFNMNNEQFKMAMKAKNEKNQKDKLPSFSVSQTLFAAFPEMRDNHDAFVRSFMSDLASAHVVAEVLPIHHAVYQMRFSVDPEFTGEDWSPCLPGDKIYGREINDFSGDVSDVLWPALAKQVIPREAEILDRRTVRVGDKIYSSAFIDLYPKELRTFSMFFSRISSTGIPWRITFLVESNGLPTLSFNGMLSGILSFTSGQNRLINDSVNLLKYLDLNTDETLVRVRVIATTEAPENDFSLLRKRASELVKAMQGWGSMDISEMCGDPFEAYIATTIGVSLSNPAIPTVAPLSQMLQLMPWTRPASPWPYGALLFRSPDGKPWPFQPGSNLQTTWIDLIYARPGSGKSVLANAQNLGLCLLGGIPRLPRISIIDIGPSSSGLISLLREALPPKKRHYVAYYRMQMTPEYSINPFDTQLGFRHPTALERAFIVNLVTLLTTPIGSSKPYDGMADLVGLVVDEMYKAMSEEGKPSLYSPNVEPLIDSLLEEIGFVRDAKSTWWEVTDALFAAGLEHEAGLAQRFAMPLLSDAASICRLPAIEDLYGKISTPTGEMLISAFSRMISAAVREYPILSRVTAFDIGEARIISLDLDEVAKSGGDAADRQTAVMYMLARYVMARNYYLTEEVLKAAPEQYEFYHRERIREIREDPKRIVYDEFHRTSKAQSVRDQVLVDMREGRKWNVQVSLLSQSVDDFDSIMIDFATAIYIMDAGPSQAIEKTCKIFGLSETAKKALSTKVHGPRAGGGTFLAQYSTKAGSNIQLLTLTLGPIELWAFSTTAEDVLIRNTLYRQLGPIEARRYLAILFPDGSASKELQKRLNMSSTGEDNLITEEEKDSIMNNLIKDIIKAYGKDPNRNALAEV
ncbi:MAG: type IV secretion protein IcmB [Gammaproteobacteria bacterium]|nr:type IV secretion protein IcmB [Gammaproteobacteria bacterium]